MRQMFAVISGFLVAVMVVATPTHSQPMDPTAVVRAYITTANTGDFNATLAFYAENAVVRNPLGLFVGKHAIGQWLQQDVQATRSTPQDFQVNGSTVFNTGTVSLARFKSIGIDPVAYRSEYRIENGKIRFFSPTVLLTPEQQAQVQAATLQPATPPNDPVELVKNYVTAANSGDFAKTIAFYADGAVFKTAFDLFVGKEAIGRFLQQDVQTTRATANEFQVINGGTTVMVTGMVSVARFEALGLGQTAFRSEFLITGDKISYFSVTPLLTPEQQAKVRAAGPPSAALPATGGTASTATLWLLAFAGLMLLLGVTLHHRRIRTR